MAGAKQVACTRDDVAKLAKVSSASVSRAYNSPGLLSPEKLSRVMDAARRLGYVPDRNASALRRPGSGVALLVLRAPDESDRSESRVYRWFHSDILMNCLRVVEKASCRLQPVLLGSQAGLKGLLDSNPCDGVVFGIGCYDPGMRPKLAKASVPFVVCSQQTLFDGVELCRIDEEAGGFNACDAMLKAGRRKLAHISGELYKNGVCMSRWLGFKRRASQEGIAPLLLDGGLGVKGGFETARRMLPDIKAGKVDGLFVVNDLTAVGVMQALLEAGVSVPGDVAMLGYDNLPFIHTLPVRLASMEMPIGAVHARAMEILVDRVRSSSAHPLAAEALSPCLAPGDSLPSLSKRCQSRS